MLDKFPAFKAKLEQAYYDQDSRLASNLLTLSPFGNIAKSLSIEQELNKKTKDALAKLADSTEDVLNGNINIASSATPGSSEIYNSSKRSAEVVKKAKKQAEEILKLRDKALKEQDSNLNFSDQLTSVSNDMSNGQVTSP